MRSPSLFLLYSPRDRVCTLGIMVTKIRAFKLKDQESFVLWYLHSCVNIMQLLGIFCHKEQFTSEHVHLQLAQFRLILTLLLKPMQRVQSFLWNKVSPEHCRKKAKL